VSGDVLGQRALNRALLERQMLLRRGDLPALDVIERLVGLQAQAPYAPYVGLWTRLDSFQPEQLARLIETREAVRLVLMRSTIHLVTARDCLQLRPLLQVVQDRALNGNFRRQLDRVDLEELATAGRALVEEKPLTFTEIGRLLGERWPDRDEQALAMAVRARLALVQVPPRGIWGAGGLARHTTAESWLGRPLDAEPSVDRMVLRYLAAFGPATVKDVQTWSGLTRLREVTDRLQPQLRVFRDESGNQLYDLPDAPRPDPETPAPVRFLPEYDNLLLSHADRARVIADGYNERIFTRGGVLVDGFAGGAWKIARKGGTATLQIEPFVRLSARDWTAVYEEGNRLLEFAAADQGTRDVAIGLSPGG
jgi:hypothetical protein